MQKYIPYLPIILFFSFVTKVEAQIVPEQIKVIVTNEGLINSEELEYCPTFYEDGLVFVSTKYPSEEYRIKDRRINKNIMSIYVSKRNAEELLDVPSVFSENLLTIVHEGPVSFDRTQETMFFTRNNIKNGKKIKASDGIVKLKIFTASKSSEGNWGNVVELPFNDNESSACHPSLSPDGDKLFFASDRAGGYGGMDIYVCEKQGDTWGEPKNLGASINSESNEVFPFIHADGTLYFASNNSKSLGGYDINFSDLNKGVWSVPQNLGKPFNSEADDLGFILDNNKKLGYFSSNRKGGKGEDDIYSFQVIGEWGGKSKGSEIDLAINAIDINTKKPIEDVEMQIINLDDIPLATANGDLIKLQSEKGFDDQVILKLVVEGATQEKGNTDTDGNYLVKAQEGKYVVIAKKKGYVSKQIINQFDKENRNAIVEMESGENYILLTGAVTSGLNKGAIPNSKIIVFDETTGKYDTISVDKNGEYEYFMKPGHQYTTTPIVGGKLYPSQRVYADGTSPNVDMNFEIPDYNSPVGIGTTFELPNIFYNFNDAELRPEGKRDLDALTVLLQQYPSMDIELSSHTDSRGPDTYNNRLSNRRAEIARNYLVANGIAAERIEAIGYGENAIRNGCTDGKQCGEPEHQYNRRTEVKITRVNASKNSSTQSPIYTETPNTSGSGSNQSATIESAMSGNFYVICGTFKNLNNANNQLEKMRNMGYPDAKIVQFNSNGYNAVCVGTYTDQDSAKALAETLNDQKVDTYVRFQEE
ncbi:MAG: PD40 domain-containing protein [Saprospiraceae bacterium]|nr:PD40 domain-containing protein [Saprospiraceae bacterium]MBP7699231.1 PD40 domain-containing protein [Saprospiraceae bacterium]